MKNTKALASFFMGVIISISGCKSSDYSDVPASLSKAEISEYKDILESQSDEVKARYAFRHPAETLQFFKLTPGQTVVEILPGQGWYTKILLPYLGAKGQLIGVDYPISMWPNFPFGNDDFIAKRKNWAQEWTLEAREWAGESGAQVQAYTFDQIPASLNGSVDTVLFIRALHNLARFDSEGGYLGDALKRCYELLKPGGRVGIVQHAVDEYYGDDWADGSKGYLKASFVKQKMKEAGFEFVAESQINANPKDKPSEEDIVWRLPPSLSTSKDNPELREKMEAIGESNRMTLLFRKPK